MHLVSILSSNGYLENSANRITATRMNPDARAGFLMNTQNALSESSISVNDFCQFRSVTTNRHWRFGGFREHNGSPTEIAVEQQILFRSTAGRFPDAPRVETPALVRGFRILSERYWPDVIEYPQFFQITQARESTVFPGATEVKLAVLMPESTWGILCEYFGISSISSCIETFNRRNPGVRVPLGRMPLPLSLSDDQELVATLYSQVNEKEWFTTIPHSTRAYISINNRYLSQDSEGLVRSNITRPNPFRQTFTLFGRDDQWRRSLSDGDRVMIGIPDGRLLGLGEDNSIKGIDPGSTRIPFIFWLERDLGPGEIGDRGQVRFQLPGINTGGLTLPTQYLALDSESSERKLRLVANRDDPNTLFRLDLSTPLRLFVRESNNDQATTADMPPSYYSERNTQVLIFLGPRTDPCIPVRRFFMAASGEITRIFATSTEDGADLATSLGYSFGGIDGYVFSDSQLSTVALKRYRNNSIFRLLANKDDERRAAAEGFTFSSIEGYAFPPPNPPNIEALPIAPPVLGTGTRTVALVLSGGGAKGAFEAGAVQHLINQGLRPQIICGVSAGAINAIKLAEGRNSAEELVRLWLRNSSEPGRIFHRELYTKLAEHLLILVKRQLEKEALGAVDQAFVGMMLGIAFGPLASIVYGGIGGAKFGDVGLGLALGAVIPAPIVPTIGGFVNSFLGTNIKDSRTIRLVNLSLCLLHSIHSMRPLHQRIAEEINYDNLRSSGIELRMGITDIKSGQYFTVTGPRWGSGPLAREFGQIIPEPDHRVGGSWLNNPVLGADTYAIRIKDALYGSCALPVYMEPLMIDLADARLVQESVAQLPTGPGNSMPLPPGLAELSDLVTRPAQSGKPWYEDDVRVREIEGAIDRALTDPTFDLANTAAASLRFRLGGDGERGRESRYRYLFDGGLRDTLPIRTALAMGVDEVICITGDKLQQFTRSYAVSRRLDQNLNVFNDVLMGSGLHHVNAMSTPLAQHLFSLLGIWFNEASRSDMMLAIAQAEFLGWMKRAANRMPTNISIAFVKEFEEYWNKYGYNRAASLGATGWLGGTPQDPLAYGKPGRSKGVKITYIAPEREILGPLDFDNGSAIRDAIEHGKYRARFPVLLTSNS